MFKSKSNHILLVLKSRATSSPSPPRLGADSGMQDFTVARKTPGKQGLLVPLNPLLAPYQVEIKFKSFRLAKLGFPWPAPDPCL